MITSTVFLHFASVMIVCEGATIRTSPLYLTRYIKAGDVAKARNDARNGGMFSATESYSGYLTVNESTRTNLFFWYFKAETTPENAPVILWLQGGPGGPSLYGALFENGPYTIQRNLTLKRRDDYYYWSKLFHVLYVDNPTGTGFSFTDMYDYAENECDVGSDLYEALIQFFTLFPEIVHRDFYVSGESYAGKYIPAIAHYIHTQNPTADVKINLKGIAIGNGIIDPPSQVKYGDHLYQLGMIDDVTLGRYNTLAGGILSSINREEWYEASDRYFALWDLVQDSTGFENLYNLLESKDNGYLALLNRYLAQPDVRSALNVGYRNINPGRTVASSLMNDRMKSVKNWFIEVLENYNVLLYNGQLDLVRPYVTSVNFIDQLRWSGRDEYKKKPRNIWRVEDNIAGYSKTVFRKKGEQYIQFTEVLVRNAGHMVPADQPKWALDMMSRFTRTPACYPADGS